MPDDYHTLAREHRPEEERIKGSRFLATAAPVRSEEEAERFVDRIRAEFPHATHHCWAWRLGPEGDCFRSSDDGEPSGSAGRPILQQIEGHELTDTAVVVTRWFGGTKLGVGGLVRAYGGAAGHVLDRAERRTVIATRRMVIEHPYGCSGAVEGLLTAHALAPREAEYLETVRLVVDVPLRMLDEFLDALRDRTAGRARCGPQGD